MPTIDSILLSSIVIAPRLRKDYGSLTDLDSIADIGLIQPIVLQDIAGVLTLMAGGRRYAWLSANDYTTLYHGTTCDPEKPGFVWREEVPEHVAKEIELMENLGRKAMTWQERVLSIYEIHQLKSKENLAVGTEWGQKETGKLVGYDKGHTSHMLRVADELRKGTKTILESETFAEAYKAYLKVLEDEAEKKMLEFAAKRSGIVLPNQPTAAVKLPDGTTPALPPPLEVPLSHIIKQGDCLHLMNELPAESVDNIITDWPYGIDMANFGQMDVSSVAAEHDEQDNRKNFGPWLTAMYRVLKDKSFCVIWTDTEVWQLQKGLALLAGFHMQEWPLYWIKTHPCMNGAAQFNFTKRTEVAMVLRKGMATLQKQQPMNYWTGDNLEARTTYGHPFAKPAGLWTWLYDAVCMKGQTVLDPFAGRGSSTIPAITFGLLPIAFESSDAHYPHLTTNVRAHYHKLTNGNVKFL